MTTPLDRDLAERLERLAAAVPVRAGQLDLVHAGAVRARQQLRWRWVTPLVALLLLALLAGLIGIGTLNVLNGPISTTTRVGDFVLTFSSAKAQYATGEPVELSASLTYVGPKPLVRIHHAHLTPLGFGFTEPINGYQLSPGWRMSCEAEDLLQGLPLVRGFRKSGGNSDDPPGFMRFMNDPNLTLPAGRWHPYAVASFGVDDCGSSESYDIRADLTIDVVDRPTPTARPTPTLVVEVPAIHVVNADPSTVEIVFRDEVVGALACGESTAITPGELGAEPPWTLSVRDMAGEAIDAVTLDGKLPAGILIRDGAVLSGPWPMSYGPATDSCDAEPAPSPSPSPTPDLAPSPEPNVSQASTDIDGDFEFVLTSDKRVYRPDEPILIQAQLTYRGTSDTVLIGYDTTPVSFWIFEKVFGTIKVGGLSLLTCGTQTLARNEPLVAPFQKAGHDTGDDDDRFLAWMKDPVLRLPVGTWHITARSGSPCLDHGVPYSVGGQLTIVVSDDPAATPGLPAATE